MIDANVDARGVITRRHGQEKHLVEPWGPDGFRVRITHLGEIRDDLPQSLLPLKTCGDGGEKIDGGLIEVVETEDFIKVIHGKTTAVMDITGRLSYFDSSSGELLCEEVPMRLPSRSQLGRQFKPVSSEHFECSLEFRAHEEECFYGLGEHPNGFLNQKGCVYDLYHQNTSFNIPFAVSNRGYGFLWNNPAVGRVELGYSKTKWVAQSSCQIDYWVTSGSYEEIMYNYASATGFSPMMPESVAGFWQCKLRYKNQSELMEAALEHQRRGIPLDVMVIDFCHWPHLGDFKVFEEEWPDLEGLAKALDEMGVKLMISVHPAVNPQSENWEAMTTQGLIIHNERGLGHVQFWRESNDRGGGSQPTCLIDSTNPETRKFLWNCLKKNYFEKGVKIFWLDCTEPGTLTPHWDHMRLYMGNAETCISYYPMAHAQGVYEGMKAEGEEDIILMCRAGYAGIQRYGAALWSGDIECTFEELRLQITAGLNVSMSGIPWWNTDIGGFRKGDTDSETYGELLVRWFQYAVFTPIFRLHGDGYDTEIWKEDPKIYAILKSFIHMRERLKPYILEQMRLAHEKGLPPMRPVFFDHPDDPDVADVKDAFKFGSELLVAPITTMGQRQRECLLPKGCRWRSVWTQEVHDGGTCVQEPAALEQIPLFVREDSSLDAIIRTELP